MREKQKGAIAHVAAVDADAGQSLVKEINSSLPNSNADDKRISKKIEDSHTCYPSCLAPKALHTLSMNEIYDTTYDVRPPIIDGMLYPGTYLFVGAPKVGKSFFMAQLAYHVSIGKELWNFPVRQGMVLYLALEDDYARLQHRLSHMFDVEGTDNLRFATYARKIGTGLDEQLKGYMKVYPSTSLVIIDTLQKVREGSGEGYSYSSDYDLIARLKQLADEYRICLLLVHHTRKQKADDHFDMISGTNGLMGAADGSFVMQKAKRANASALLEVCGRDQPDQKFHLTRDLEHLYWNLEKREAQSFVEPPEPLLDAIAQFLNADRNQWKGTATELVELLNYDLRPNKITMKLNVHCARLFNEYGITYQSEHTRNKRIISLMKNTMV